MSRINKETASNIIRLLNEERQEQVESSYKALAFQRRRKRKTLHQKRLLHRPSRSVH